MIDLNLAARFSRRRAFALGGSVAGGLITAGAGVNAGLILPADMAALSRDHTTAPDLVLAAADTASTTLPVSEIEAILQGPGTVSNGVLNVSLDRSDLHVTGPLKVPFRAPFELTHASTSRLSAERRRS